MTAKDKAKELVEKMLGDNNHYLNQNIEIDKLIAKQCALICVDEIIRNEVNTTMHPNDSIMDYWQEVKQELTKTKKMSKKKKKRKIKFNFKPTSQEARRKLLESAGMPIEVDQTKPKQR